MKKTDVKITFIGDITCDRPLMNASRVKVGEYDFDAVFSKASILLDQSDYVVGNFETVCADSKDDFKDQYMLLNTPDQFVGSMKRGGIDCVTTSNNHCLDQGIKGLARTLDILDKSGMEHTGTYRNAAENERVFVKTISGVSFAIVAGTYATNATNIETILDDKNCYHVDILRNQKPDFEKSIKGRIKQLIFLTLSAAQRRTINRFKSRIKLKMGKTFLSVRTDSVVHGDFDNPYLKKWLKKIVYAKSLADIVFVCPHMGGQFNEFPGEYSKKLIDMLFDEIDVIIGNHPHISQRVVISKQGKIGAYSLGSFNQSISADYMIHDSLPEYSIALHVYVSTVSKKIYKVTFSILKIVEDTNGKMIVYPSALLYDQLKENERHDLISDMTIIYKRVTGKEVVTLNISKEYEIYCRNNINMQDIN